MRSIHRRGRMSGGPKALYPVPPGMSRSSQLVFMLREHVIRLWTCWGVGTGPSHLPLIACCNLLDDLPLIRGEALKRSSSTGLMSSLGRKGSARCDAKAVKAKGFGQDHGPTHPGGRKGCLPGNLYCMLPIAAWRAWSSIYYSCQ